MHSGPAKLKLGWLAAAACVGCAVQIDQRIDLRYATARAATQTPAGWVQLSEGEPQQPYYVLGDITLHAYQITSFGETPTRDALRQALRERAAALGANAVILVRFGEQGMGWISYSELEVRGRAVRY